jgi:Carboxypeptidase regulatory-like domain
MGNIMKTDLKSGTSLLILILTLLFLWTQAGAQTASVKGKVKELKGNALDGVLVRATNQKNKDLKYESNSDNKGEFVITGLPAGEYSFAFEKKNYKKFTTRKIQIAAGETLNLNRVIELTKESVPYALIRGAVLYGTGYSLPGASVLIERIDGKKFKQETISLEAGEFAFRLKAEPAKYRITASNRGFQPASIEIQIDDDEVRNIVLNLQPEK